KGVIDKIAKSEGNVHVVGANVGQITESDIKSMVGTRALVVGFRSKVDKAAENLAEGQHIRVYTSDIIYKLEDEVRACLRLMFRKPSGVLAVLAVFGEWKGNEGIMGGKVSGGIIRNQSAFEIRKGNEILGEGKIKNLQVKKKDVSEAKEGQECGMLVESAAPIEAGEELYFFE
ncbi:MAG: hypothetical protein AAB634_02045, partial [Patescibacteria group bacterium]